MNEEEIIENFIKELDNEFKELKYNCSLLTKRDTIKDNMDVAFDLIKKKINKIKKSDSLDEHLKIKKLVRDRGDKD